MINNTDYISWTEVSEPRWADVNKQSIHINVKWSTVGKVDKALLSPNLPDTHIQKLLEEVLQGKYGKIADYVPHVPVPPSAAQNKQSAILLLQETDWVEFPSVSNKESVPHLLNTNEFIAYRDALRQIAVYPRPGNLDWPTKPTEQWSR